MHGTAIAFDSHALLLRGASGCGKSDLALRTIQGGACRSFGQEVLLVADDQAIIFRNDSRLIVRAPQTIAGKIEVRGIDIVEMSYRKEAELCLIVDLIKREEVPRLSPLPRATETFFGLEVPLLRLNPFECSAPIKLHLAMEQLSR